MVSKYATFFLTAKKQILVAQQAIGRVSFPLQPSEPLKLTLSQTTNSRLFQTERVFRQQFLI